MTSLVSLVAWFAPVALAQPAATSSVEPGSAQVEASTTAEASAPAEASASTEPNPLPDPRHFHRGLYADAEVGSVVFLGAAGGSIEPGVALGLRVGYDFARFVGLQLFGGGSSHTLSRSDSPQAGQLLQLYAAGAELELRLPLGRFAIVGRGRGGFLAFSTNILGTTSLALTQPDVRSTPFFGGGLGVDFHTLSRHFSFGLHGSFIKLQKVFTRGAIAAGLDVRYTF